MVYHDIRLIFQDGSCFTMLTNREKKIALDMQWTDGF